MDSSSFFEKLERILIPEKDAVPIPGSSASFHEVAQPSLETHGSPLEPEKAPAIDVLIITAKTVEAEMLEEVLPGVRGEWYLSGLMCRRYFVKMSTGDSVAAMLITQPNMGLTSAAITATKAIQVLKPRLVIMVGICAGVEDTASIGDVVIARFVLDYGSGKLTENDFYPNYHPIQTDPGLVSLFESLARKRDVLSRISKSFGNRGNKPRRKLRVVCGPMGSGQAVVTDSKLVQSILKHQRDLRAIDMEAYGIAHAALEAPRGPVPAIVVKGVSDLCIGKNDDYQKYAAYVSAAFAVEFLRTCYRRWIADHG